LDIAEELRNNATTLRYAHPQNLAVSGILELPLDLGAKKVSKLLKRLILSTETSQRRQ
jgi:hypothetical protein